MAHYETIETLVIGIGLILGYYLDLLIRIFVEYFDEYHIKIDEKELNS
jgi:hypothetical protein